jgi:sterol desaturase/sphingolipid hydroxylase (fatty acid hydroxylase superfamily)
MSTVIAPPTPPQRQRVQKADAKPAVRIVVRRPRVNVVPLLVLASGVAFWTAAGYALARVLF